VSHRLESSANLMYSLEGKSTIILIPRTLLESDFQKKNLRKNNLIENKNKKKRKGKPYPTLFLELLEGPDCMKKFCVI